MEDKDLQSRYVLASLNVKYRELNNCVDEKLLYPGFWTSYKFITQIKILNEAIAKGILIKDTDGYNEVIEGVKIGPSK